MVQRTQNDFPKMGATKMKSDAKSGSISGEPMGILDKGLPGYSTNGKMGTPMGASAKTAKDPKISPKV